MSTKPYISIFETLKDDLGGDLNTVMLTKATLVHLSHTLEDFVLQRHLPAMIFTGFQESSHWRKETKRYQALADVAMQVCIFAGKPLPPDADIGALQIELTGDDPLRQEWFLAILSTDFSVILAGLDNMESVPAEAHRRFETLWSFDVSVVNKVLDSLEGVIERYRPDMLAPLQAARRNYPPIEPTSDIILRFTNELLRIEDRLQRDIYQTTRDLRISEAHYRSVVAHAPVAVLTLSVDGMIQVVEDNLSHPLFTGHFTALGEHISTLFEAVPQLKTIFEQAQVAQTTYNILEASQGFFDVHTRIVHAEELSQTIIIIIFVDVTERQKIGESQAEQERLRLSLAKEQEISEIRRQLMMTLSHELRTPLASIQVSSDLLSRYYERLSAEKRKSRVENIQHQINHLKHILDDINAVIRNEDTPFGGDVKRVDVGAIVTTTIDEISKTMGRPITFLSSGILQGLYFDPQMIRYIVSNLVSNAVKFSSDGTPIICEVRRKGEHVIIQVQDHGIGIPTEEQAEVLKPFYRASNVGVIGGSGLGLSIISNVVTTIEGDIEIDSQNGQGTTITVRLPIQTASDDITDSGSLR